MSNINQRQLRHLNLPDVTVAKAIPFREDEITFISSLGRGFICDDTASHTPDDQMTILLSNGKYLNSLFKVYDDKFPKLGSSLDANYYNILFRTGSTPGEPGASTPTVLSGISFVDDQIGPGLLGGLYYNKTTDAIEIVTSAGRDLNLSAPSSGSNTTIQANNKLVLGGIQFPTSAASAAENGYTLIYNHTGGIDSEPTVELMPIISGSSYRGTIEATVDNLDDYVPISVGDYWVCINTGTLDSGATTIAVTAGGQVIANTDMPTAPDVVNTKFDFVPQILPSATETTEGVTEIATQTEVDTGTDDFRYVTPKKLKLSKPEHYITGFRNFNAEVTISINTSTREITIEPTGTSYVYYIQGQKFTITTIQTVTWPNAYGVYNAFLDTSGTFNVATYSYFQQNINEVYGILYQPTGTFTITGNRMFNAGNSYESLYRSFLEPCLYVSGYDVTGVTTNGPGNMDTELEIDTNNGIHFWSFRGYSNSASAQPKAPLYASIFYLVSGQWRQITPTYYGVITTGSGRAAYSDGTNLLEANHNSYVVMHLIMSSTDSKDYYWVPGDRQYTTLAEARSNILISLDNLRYQVLHINLSLPIASFLVHTSNSYSNSKKSIYVDVNGVGDKFIDWRVTPPGTFSNSNAVAPVDHQSLTNRDATGAHIADAISFDNSLLNYWASQNIQLVIDEITANIQYIYTAPMALSSWVINHNLHRNPIIQTYDSGGDRIFGTVNFNTTDQVTINFSTITDGIAILT